MAKKEEKGGGQASAVNIAKLLHGIDFPVHRQELINHARKNGADESAIKMFNEMPDIEYKSVKDVVKEYGKKHREALSARTGPEFIPGLFIFSVLLMLRYGLRAAVRRDSPLFPLSRGATAHSARPDGAFSERAVREQ